MKKIKFFIVLLVFFLSGCTDFLNTYRAQFVIQQEFSTNDVYYAVDVYPSEVYSGEKLKIRFRIIAEKDLKDVKIKIIDPCLFEVEGINEKSVGNLHKGMRKTVTFELNAKDVEMNTNCRIKFKLTYISSTKLIQDVVVLSSNEYREREESGTLDEIEISSSKEPSSVDIDLTFSEAQPFRENRKIQIFIQYRNLGNGIVEKLEVGDVKITFPENLEIYSCSVYKKANSYWKLSEPLQFYNGETEKTVCNAITKANIPIDVGKILIEERYKYEFEDYINVKILKR